MTPHLTRRTFLASAAALCVAPGPLLADPTRPEDEVLLTKGWQYYQGPLDPRFQVWHSEELVTWRDVTVPHCFNAHDSCDPDTPAYRGPGWYRMSLPVANPHPGGRTVLLFGAAGQRAEVYVGSQLVGTHSGGYDEFLVDITPFCQGSPVQLAVLCDNGRDLDRMPSDLSDFTLYGGLYRPVHLRYLPAVSGASLYTEVQWQPGTPARLSIRASLYAPAAPQQPLIMRVRILSPGGTVLLDKAMRAPLWEGERELLRHELPSPELWSPDSPRLYRTELTLTSGADTSSVSQPFGVRHVRFEEHGPFFLNGKRLLIQGTHRHEDFAGYAAAIPDDVTRQQFAEIKQMGANFVRLTHYPQSRLVLDLCDELGLMVWEELPWCRSGVGDTLFQQRGRAQLTSMIEQHRNHPSIILWGLGNEDDWPGEWRGEDHAAIRSYMTELRDLAHTLDPARLTAYRRGEFVRDIPDVYSPSIWSGWYSGNYRDYESALVKGRDSVPRFLHVEYGADSHAGRHAEDLPDLHGTPHAKVTEDWSETYACDLFDWYLKTQAELPWLTGAVQWAFADFTTPLRVTNPVPRVNQKGVTTRDGQSKESYFVFQSWWTKKPMLRIYGHSWPVRWGVAGQERLVRVYSNCGEVELFLNGASCGKRRRDPADFPCSGLRWDVRFRPGPNTLRAVAVGAPAPVQDTLSFQYQTESWGKPAELRLAAVPAPPGSTRMEATLHDAHGVLCLDAASFVRFGVTGAARLQDNLGTPTDSRVVQLYNGRASLSLTQNGAATGSVQAEGLPPALLNLPWPASPAPQGPPPMKPLVPLCRCSVSGAALSLALALPFAAAQVPTPTVPTSPTQDERPFAGDAPADPGPLAKLSPDLKQLDVNAAMVKVMDWSLRVDGPHFNRLWTYAALYDGLLAASAATGHPEGHDAVLAAAEGWHWQLEDTRFPHADDEALGQAYLDLYREHPEPGRIAPTQAIMDRLAARPDVPGKPVWWWCDALFMVPPVLVRLAAITHDPKYDQTLNREWDITAAALYNPVQHLYYRDDRFLDVTKQHEANGQPVFWSRGNGWVIGGLVNILEYLPEDDPHRAAYTQQFVDMMTRIAALQPADGLWRAGLLNAEAYKMPEVSGSAFFTYGIAYGLRMGLLDRQTFLPVLRRAWSAMVAHIYADGRLGNIQPIGFAPDAFTPSSSYVYGVGAFLLAGSEIDQLLQSKPVMAHAPNKRTSR